jgi:hypothetical protein
MMKPIQEKYRGQKRQLLWQGDNSQEEPLFVATEYLDNIVP